MTLIMYGLTDSACLSMAVQNNRDIVGWSETGGGTGWGEQVYRQQLNQLAATDITKHVKVDRFCLPQHGSTKKQGHCWLV